MFPSYGSSPCKISFVEVFDKLSSPPWLSKTKRLFQFIPFGCYSRQPKQLLGYMAANQLGSLSESASRALEEQATEGCVTKGQDWLVNFLPLLSACQHAAQLLTLQRQMPRLIKCSRCWLSVAIIVGTPEIPRSHYIWDSTHQKSSIRNVSLPIITILEIHIIYCREQY